MKLLFVAAVLTVAYARHPYPALSLPYPPAEPPRTFLPSGSTTSWTGPIADHQLGVAPVDTPEVTAAKQDHLRKQQELLSVLPPLSPEERYRQGGLSLEAVLALQQQGHDELNRRIAALLALQLPFAGITPKWTGPIANHRLGELPSETPEVAAAKADLLKVQHELLSVLPTLSQEELSRTGLSESEIISLMRKGEDELNQAQLALAQAAASDIPVKKWTGAIADHKLGFAPRDTIEVASAKADHLQAHRQAVSQLPSLSAFEASGQTSFNNIAKTVPVVPAVAPFISTQSTTVWTGPTADHKLGVVPSDTPAVAAAKADHIRTQNELLSVLPRLTEEEQHSGQGLSEAEVLSLQQQGHDALNKAQLALTIPAAAEIPTRPWHGPLADPKPGFPPRDTSEVIAAKADHLKAHREAAAVLPVLSQEEQNLRHVPSSFSSASTHHSQFSSSHQSVSAHQGSTSSSSTQHWTGPIADHRLGFQPRDTPAVTAARTDHLRTQEELRARLPALPVEHSDISLSTKNALISPITPVKKWNGPIADHQLGVPPADTPEVSAAKAVHLKVFREALEGLPDFPELPSEAKYSKLALPYPNQN